MENVQEELEAHLKNTVILIGMEAFDDSKPILTQCNEVLKKLVELASGHYGKPFKVYKHCPK